MAWQSGAVNERSAQVPVTPFLYVAACSPLPMLPALLQPRAEEHVVVTAAWLGLVIHCFVPLSVYEFMITMT